VKPEAGTGPITGIFAMATRSDYPLDSSKLVMELGNGGMAIHTMYLDQPRLVLDFAWLSPKDKTPTLAEAARPGRTTVASKATD
jgi:hypothetical protein